MNNFPWGTIVQTHTIHELPPIIEYISGPEWGDAGKTCFHVETKNMGSASYETFDQALVALFCDKYDSHETAPFVWRLLKVGAR